MMFREMKKTLKNMMQLHAKQALKQGIYMCFFGPHLSHFDVSKTQYLQKTQDLQNNVDKEPYKERDRNKIMSFKNMII
jgi:hypothetical protein